MPPHPATQHPRSFLIPFLDSCPEHCLTKLHRRSLSSISLQLPEHPSSGRHFVSFIATGHPGRCPVSGQMLGTMKRANDGMKGLAQSDRGKQSISRHLIRFKERNLCTIAAISLARCFPLVQSEWRLGVFVGHATCGPVKVSVQFMLFSGLVLDWLGGG